MLVAAVKIFIKNGYEDALRHARTEYLRVRNAEVSDNEWSYLKEYPEPFDTIAWALNHGPLKNLQSGIKETLNKYNVSTTVCSHGQI